MKTKKFILLLTVNSLLGAFAQSTANEKMTLTLKDAVDISLQNNISLQKSKLDLKKLEIINKYSWNSISPSLSGKGSFNSGLEENTNSYSISGTVSIGFSTNLFSTINGAKLNYQNGLISYKQSEKSIALSVQKAFYGLLYAEENLKLQKRGLETSRIQFENNQEKFKNGKISELDVMTSEVNYKKKKPLVESAELSYKNDLSTFKQILGLPLETEITLKGSLDKILEIKSVDTNKIDVSKNTSPSIQAAQKSVEIAKNNLGASRFSAYGPSINASFTIGETNSYDNKTEVQEWKDNKSLSVAVSIPLDGYLPWTTSSANVKNNKNSVKTAELNLEDEKLKIQIQTENCLRKINQEISQISSLKANVELAEQTYTMSKTAYNYGKIDILSLQNASDSVLSAEVSLKQQAFNLICEILDLEYLQGLEFGSIINY